MTALDAERKLLELSFLHEIAQLAASARDWDEMLRIVIERTTHAMRAEVSSLYLLERAEGVLRLVATNGLNHRSIGRATLRVGEGITGWVANARVPLAARDVRTDPRFKWIPGVDEERFVSMLSVPVVAREEVIGVMNVQTVEPREFHREEIDFLQTIANQVAGIIEKGRLQRDSDRKLREVSALFEVSNVLTSTLELDEVLALVVDRLVRVYPGASGAIYLREDDEVRERARSGEPQRAATQAAHRALAERRPIVAFDHIALPLLVGDRLLRAVVLQVPDYTEFPEGGGRLEAARFAFGPPRKGRGGTEGAGAGRAAPSPHRPTRGRGDLRARRPPADRRGRRGAGAQRNEVRPRGHAHQRAHRTRERSCARQGAGRGARDRAAGSCADVRAVRARRGARRRPGIGDRSFRLAPRRRVAGRRHLVRG